MPDKILNELGVLGEGVDPSSVDVDLCLETLLTSVDSSISSSDEDVSNKPSELFFFSRFPRTVLPLSARVQPAFARVPVATSRGGVDTLPPSELVELGVPVAPPAAAAGMTCSPPALTIVGGEYDTLDPLNEALASDLPIARGELTNLPGPAVGAPVGDSSISEEEDPVAALARDVTELEILCRDDDAG